MVQTHVQLACKPRRNMSAFTGKCSDNPNSNLLLMVGIDANVCLFLFRLQVMLKRRRKALKVKRRNLLVSNQLNVSIIQSSRFTEDSLSWRDYLKGSKHSQPYVITCCCFSLDSLEVLRVALNSSPYIYVIFLFQTYQPL